LTRAERLRPDANGITRAAELVRAGEVVAFPTDTVYGLMALPSSAERIYRVKRRPADKRLIAMAADRGALTALVRFSPNADAYAERYWPGPLTLVLPAAQEGGPSLGVRIPDHRVALHLLAAIGEPVMTTSANLSGQPPARRAEEVALDGVAAVLDGGATSGGEPSTVLLLDRPRPEVARVGAIPAEELLAAWGSTVGIHRRGVNGREWLMLHRTKHGAASAGDWAWGPPAGSRRRGETSLACARRELLEETGLDAEPAPAGGTGRWDVYALEVDPAWEPRLSREHDRHEWLSLDQALERSRPRAAVEELRLAARATGHQ
jgi:tRNA threonylcarbamoyl adenosine modification protein (Sua5/YciO/YrdC/YwlC family)